nr:retrovirus-related Pol polyprotein from transposon TNT 1-94 [Tanacetum cinerariifolium]
VNLPVSIANRVAPAISISELNESLVVSAYTNEVNGLVYSVWMMREEGGVMSSFTKLFNINTPRDSPLISKLQGFTMSGEPIMETEKDYGEFATVEVYKPCSEHINDLGINGETGSFFICLYTETLLLIDHSDCRIVSNDEDVERSRMSLDVPVELLLQRIQSLLPPKDAASTCILSKSWLRAWSTIPNLRFIAHEPYGQSGGVDQKLVAVVCLEIMKIFQGKNGMEDKSHASTSQAGKLIQTNNLTAHFYPNDFMFQDPTTKEIVAVGKAYIETHFQAEPKFIRSDNGTEIVNTTYLINKMPMKKLQWKSPYEVLHKKPPAFDHLRVIGCLSYAVVTRPYKDKFDNRGIKCILIGYPQNQKGYKLYNLVIKEVFLSRDVLFDEKVFPFKDTTPIHPNSMFNMPTFADESFEDELSPLPNILLPPDSTTSTPTTHNSFVSKTPKHPIHDPPDPNAFT